MKACRREPTSVTPVWLMRQAGRYMAEYRQVREKVTFLELCKDPALCSEVMCTAVARLGVDAAIVFSDLLPILEPMGLDLEFAPHGGPVVHNPVRDSLDVDRVVELESVEALHFVMEAVRQTRRDLPPQIPLIGFAGAPFTLASYAIEGGASRNYIHTKTIMYRDPGAWRALMDRFARAVTRYLNAQVAAGAQAVQLFDSWVGCLSTVDYREFVLPYVQQIIAGVAPGVPVINFATGNPALNQLLAEGGSDVVGVDWRMRLDDAWQAISTASCHPRKPGSVHLAGGSTVPAPAGSRDAGHGRGTTRPHLQSRTRHPAADIRRQCHRAGRRRARNQSAVMSAASQIRSIPAKWIATATRCHFQVQRPPAISTHICPPSGLSRRRTHDLMSSMRAANPRYEIQ